MITDIYHDQETTVYQATLCIPTISGLTAPSNTGADVGVTNGICIYLHETSHTGPNIGQTTSAAFLPIISPGGLAYGGEVLVDGAQILPRIQIEGFMDTPCIRSGEYFVPSVIDTNGIRYTYAEVIGMLVEGRANATGIYTQNHILIGFSGWERLDPLWYRDGYGRVYNNPRILDFQASYVEGIPERNQFTLVLKV